MKRGLITLSIALLALASCNQFKKGEGDMMYRVHTDADGDTINVGDFVAFKAIEKTEEDSVLYSSYDYDRPSLLIREKSVFKGDLYSALGKLSEGDSATFKINIDSMAAKMKRPKPPGSKGKYLVYTIKIDKVVPKGKQNDTVFQAKINEFMKAEMDLAKNKEGSSISKYLTVNDLKPMVTASGLNYIVTKTGKGVKPNQGDTVLANYTGKFISGKVFDTSYPEVAKKSGTFNAQRPYEPIKLPVGVNGSIPGFDEGLLLFPEGTKATLIFPSKLGYGEQGNQGIPPYTPLIFDVEVIDIIPQKASAQQPAAVTEKK